MLIVPDEELLNETDIASILANHGPDCNARVFRRPSLGRSCGGRSVVTPPSVGTATMWAPHKRTQTRQIRYPDVDLLRGGPMRSRWRKMLAGCAFPVVAGASTAGCAAITNAGDYRATDCSTTQDCLRTRGDNTICRRSDHTCQSLLSDECKSENVF